MLRDHAKHRALTSPAIKAFLLIVALASIVGISGKSLADESPWSLRLRSRVETSTGSGRFHATFKEESWKASETAIIVCDMWDLHHCLNATRRGAEVAPRMNEVLKTFRDRGSLVIHAPSGCMTFYEDHPARTRLRDVKKSSSLPSEIGQWCHKIPDEEKGQYPIDQTDGGEDDDPAEHQAWADKLTAMGRNPRAPWIRQTELLEIDERRDFIGDDGSEIWSLLEERGIRNVVLVGVHTNMCVLGRPFGLRNLSRYGKHVVLMRDMTDTMYNPLRAPYVSHFTGTDLIVEHIEKWVCPTITSDQVLGGTPFRFATDTRPRVVIACSESEYHTEVSLPRFALTQLGKQFQVTVVFGDDRDGNVLPGLKEALAEADALLVSVRRRALPEESLAAIRQFVEKGKPIVGIRTASHAFSLRGAAPPNGHAVWETWDQEVLGGNYTGHHGDGPAVTIRGASGAEQHPILRDVDIKHLTGRGSLYKVSPLAAAAKALLLGKIDGQPDEPIAWTYENQWGGRVFYTSLGHAGDFEQESFQRLLVNGLSWATSAGRE